MTCKYNYRSISLRNKTHSKLENLSNIVVKGEKLSIPKTVTTIGTGSRMGDQYGQCRSDHCDYGFRG